MKRRVLKTTGSVSKSKYYWSVFLTYWIPTVYWQTSYQAKLTPSIDSLQSESEQPDFIFEANCWACDIKNKCVTDGNSNVNENLSSMP